MPFCFLSRVKAAFKNLILPFCNSGIYSVGKKICSSVALTPSAPEEVEMMEVSGGGQDTKEDRRRHAACAIKNQDVCRPSTP